RRRGWFQGRPVHVQTSNGLHDIAWFTAAGLEMRDEDWANASANVVGIFLNGEGIATPNDYGERVVDDSFYLMFNAHHEPTRFRFPHARWGQAWTLGMDTPQGFASKRPVSKLARAFVELDSRMLSVWKR